MIRTRIFIDTPNHMPPVSSNHGDFLTQMNAAIVDDKALLSSFPIRVMYTVRLKWSISTILDHIT